MIVAALSACDSGNDSTESQATGSIMVVGDSVMAWNSDEKASIADVIAASLGREVVNASVSGARLSVPDSQAVLAGQGFDIRAQYEARGWKWLVMDGGANDLGDECACGACDATLNEILSADSLSGQYPEFVRSVRADGSRVLIMGYYPPPLGIMTEFNPCVDEFSQLNTRLAQMASLMEGVYFANATAVIDPRNLGHYDTDLVHPSIEGSRLIGNWLVQAIQNAEAE